jgi:hypothetical protein
MHAGQFVLTAMNTANTITITANALLEVCSMASQRSSCYMIATLHMT